MGEVPVVTACRWGCHGLSTLVCAAGARSQLDRLLQSRVAIRGIMWLKVLGPDLPNDPRQTVYLREILEDERWRKMKAALPIALDQDIEGARFPLVGRTRNRSRSCARAGIAARMRVAG